MNIQPCLGKYTVYASNYCRLDSNVLTGGGTNDTAILQAILDKAPQWGRLKLIMDGPALISGLTIHSNTTIECLDSSCGFFLESGSDNALFRNAEFSKTEYTAVNITFIGGTYNHNGTGQAAEFPESEWLPSGENCNTVLVPFKFFGVRNFKMTDITIIDQKRYSLLMGNWEDVFMENIDIPLPNMVPATNQDGLHFHAPGKNLVLKNIHGRTGDDFIAINGDEGDCLSSIDGVLIDGVYLNGSTQGIRLLCRERGTLENVIIRNVYGRIDSFGFYITPWFWGNDRTPGFDGTSGKFRNISIENVDVVMTDPVYDYNEQMLFCIGGDIENIRIRNVSARSDQDSFRLLSVREGHATTNPSYLGGSPTYIKNILVDGVYAAGTDSTVHFDRLFAVEGVSHVEKLALKNITAANSGNDRSLLTIDEHASVNDLTLDTLHLTGFKDQLQNNSNSK